MPTSHDLQPSPRTYTLAAADVVDADGIKTSFATSTSAVDVLPAAFNGAQLLVTATGKLKGKRYVTIARSSNANQFSVVPMTMYYKVDGREKDSNGNAYSQLSTTPGNDDGGDTLDFAIAVDDIVKFSFPVQGGNGGTFTIGVKDLAFTADDACRAVRAGAAGDLAVVYDDGGTDVMPLVAGERADVSPRRIVGATTTAYPITVFK